MAVHKISRDAVPKAPLPVRRFPMRPGDDASRERVAELIRVGFLAPSAAQSHLSDPSVDRLPPRPKS
jgi:hypothetical protein